MPPNQQYPYGPPPGYNPNQAPQQAPGGQYQVVPPLPAGQNNGHTGHNPYEFIVNPATQPKRKGFQFSGGSSLAMRLLVIVGGAVVLMIITAVVLSAFAPKGSTPQLEAIAARQQEIIRVATAAHDNTSGQDTKNFVETVQLGVTTSQQEVLNYLSSHHAKVGDKQLALDQDSQTDTLLASAKAAGTYDSAVDQTLTSQLQTYENLLQTTYKQTSNKALQQVLNDCYNSADQLLKQAHDLPTAPSDS